MSQISAMTLGIVRDYETNQVEKGIDAVQQELNKVSAQLQQDSHLGRKLRDHLASKKPVDLREIKEEIEHFQKQYQEIQNQLSEDLQTSFDFDSLLGRLDKVETKVIEDLLEAVDSAKTFLTNGIQPRVMEIEALVTKMKVILEIARLIIRLEDESAKNAISHVR